MSIKVWAVTVTQEKSDQLIKAVEEVVKNLNSNELGVINLINYQRKAIVISFDIGYRPFLGFSHGFNLPENRKFLKNGTLLMEIAEIFKQYSENLNNKLPGGRIFINSKMVIHDNDPICLFSWTGEDIYINCRNILKHYRSIH